MSRLKQIYDYYNDIRTPINHPLFVANGMTRDEILKILAVLIAVEKNQ